MLVILIGIGIIGISLLYQVLECPEQFVTHAGDILHDVEILVDLQRAEVWVKRSVIPASDCDESCNIEGTGL